ncbi:MAG: putative RDD family membrane protein YckC [Gammaproteobacteria bacterium]|jgi:uncharacterized RDD family membrane protein YckC
MNEDILDGDFKGNDFKEVPISYASFWHRVAASLIDGLVMIPIVGILTMNNTGWKLLPIYLLCWAGVTMYKPFMEYNYEATLGKMALGIKVISQDMERVSARQALERYVPWLPNQFMSLFAMVTLFNTPGFEEANTLNEIALLQVETGVTEQSMWMGLLMIISCIFVAFDSEKRGLHDMMAGTYVIHKNDK